VASLLNEEEIFSLFFFTALWIQPVIWVMIKKIHNVRLDAFLLVGAVLALGSYFPLYLLGVINQYTQLVLYYFYGLIGFSMSLAFLSVYGWRYTQALSVSALALFVSSSLWEIPLLLINAIRTGPEPDWILHLMVVFYILWIDEWPGWIKTGKLGILLPLLLTSIVITLFPITPPGSHAEWNSLPYLLTRGYSAWFIYRHINKEPIT
jgi:hypothetical protein